jgi:hypothetical protein
MRSSIIYNADKSNEPEVLSPVQEDSVLLEPIFDLLDKYKNIVTKKISGDIATIQVDEIASKLANFYEKIRKIVDWKEDNLLTRSAIQRILKRNLIAEISIIKFIFNKKPDNLSESLISELIRGGHLPNNQVPKTKISVVEKIINKYLIFLKNLSSNSLFTGKNKVNFFNWIMEIAACEIEDVLSPPRKENILIEAMTILVNDRIRSIPGDFVSDEDKMIQTYIAVHRTLFSLDDAIISYRLIKLKYPNWLQANENQINDYSDKLFDIWGEMKQELDKPISKQFFNVCENIDTVFTLIGDSLDNFQDKPEELIDSFSQKEKLKEIITENYQKRVKTLKKRLLKIAALATLSVLIGNWAMYFFVEIPLALILFEKITFWAMIFDILFPSVFMFLLVAIIKPPSKTNLKAVVELSNSFVYKNENRRIYEIKPIKKSSPATFFLITILYLFAGTLFFGFIGKMFNIAGLPITSTVLNSLVIAINVFAAIAIRNKARELTVEDKGTVWEFLLDVISIPVAQVGSWFARKWKEYNIISVFFNAFVEMPFITFVAFIEDWSTFLKEKKGNIH